MLSVWISLLLFCPAIVWTGNVLVVPVDGSHWVNMKIIVEELHSRGHTISVVRTTDSWYIKEHSPFYTAITVQSESGFEEGFITEYIAKLLEIQRNGRSPWARFKLEMEDMEAASVMHLKGAELVELPGLELSDKMSFSDRVLNTCFYCFQQFHFSRYVVPHYEGLMQKYFSQDSFMSLFQRADLWLMRIDFVFEFPRPTMPNIKYMGGFQCKPAHPLPPHLEDFVQSSGEHGVILMSLGTFVTSLPQEISEEIAAAFAKLPQKVIWRHKGERPASLGNNTLLVDWMPQNDILGHEKTKLFVAHGGTNGAQEAIYHGVPILGLPLVFDQHDNLFKIKFRGGSKILNIFTIDRESFQQGIEELLHEPSYRTTMERLSRLSRDLPMKPLDHAIFWIEYVIRNKGAGHLRSESYNMPWYSYYSVDVILLLLGLLLIMILTFVVLVKTLCSCVCRRIKRKRD
ncbi:unnamed protein product [Boreogadus saida]